MKMKFSLSSQQAPRNLTYQRLFKKSKKRQLAVTVHFSKRAQLFLLSDKIVFPPSSSIRLEGWDFVVSIGFLLCIVFVSCCFSFASH